MERINSYDVEIRKGYMSFNFFFASAAEMDAFITVFNEHYVPNDGDDDNERRLKFEIRPHNIPLPEEVD